MLYSDGDFRLASSMVAELGEGTTAHSIATGSLEAVRQYCLNLSRCRVGLLQDMFQEAAQSTGCGFCDVCVLAASSGKASKKDIGAIARPILAAVQ